MTASATDHPDDDNDDDDDLKGPLDEKLLMMAARGAHKTSQGQCLCSFARSERRGRRLFMSRSISSLGFVAVLVVVVTVLRRNYGPRGPTAKQAPLCSGRQPVRRFGAHLEAPSIMIPTHHTCDTKQPRLSRWAPQTTIEYRQSSQGRPTSRATFC